MYFVLDGRIVCKVLVQNTDRYFSKVNYKAGYH